MSYKFIKKFKKIEERKMSKISVIIPCYNEENNLLITIQSIKEITSQINKYNFKYLILNIDCKKGRKTGANEGIRTPDIRHHKPAL